MMGKYVLAHPVEAVAVGVAGADRERRDPAGAGELGVAGEPLGAGDLADELAGRLGGPKPGSPSSCGAASATSSAICASSASMVWDSSRRMAQLVAGDPHPRGLLGARQAPADRGAPFLRQQRALGERLLGPQEFTRRGPASE
jgi:hypothetical protein